MSNIAYELTVSRVHKMLYPHQDDDQFCKTWNNLVEEAKRTLVRAVQIAEQTKDSYKIDVKH